MAQSRSARAEQSGRFRAAAPALRKGGVRCSKLTPERCRAALGRLVSGPGRDERLAWNPIPRGICRTWGSDEERDSLLAEALAECTGPETRVAVVWHPFRAGLSIAAGDLAAQASPVLEAGSGETIWIVAAEGGPWLIEVAYWDRELCWTPEMPEWPDQR